MLGANGLARLWVKATDPAAGGRARGWIAADQSGADCAVLPPDGEQSARGHVFRWRVYVVNDARHRAVRDVVDLRSLPRSQIRSGYAEGILPSAGVLQQHGRESPGRQQV